MFCFLQIKVDYTKRNFGLDLMRALAIIPIIMWHGAGYLEKAGTNFPWIPIYNGVEMFFVLSGFLIGGILLRTFENTSVFNFKHIKHFYFRRWLRTLPNYYLVLLLNVLLTYYGITHDYKQFNYQFLLFLQNFAHPFQGFFWESWSLSIEEWFYLLFPLFLLGMYKLFYTQSKKTVFLATLSLFIFVPTLLRIMVAPNIATPTKFELDINFLHLVIYRLDSIALGVLGAWWHYYYPQKWQQLKGGCFVLGILLFYGTLFLPTPYSSLYRKMFSTLVISSGVLFMLPLFYSLRCKTPWILGAITHISLISYSMYLLNLGVILGLMGYFYQPQTPTANLLMYGVYWFLVLFCATLLYKYFEKPIMDLRKE